MNELLDFLTEHGVAMLSLLASVIYFSLRFIKTERSYDFVRWLLNIIDNFILTSDRKSGGGKFVNRVKNVD